MQILYPVFAMVALTAVTVFRLGYLRYTAVGRGEVDPGFYKTYQGQGEPPRIAATSRHLVNLFETPVLFYVVVILAYMTGQGGPSLTVLAWAYVAARILHTWIHLRSNVVLWRFRVFILSWIVLLAMWVTLAVELARGS
jgi:hypothetical protein